MLLFTRREEFGQLHYQSRVEEAAYGYIQRYGLIKESSKYENAQSSFDAFLVVTSIGDLRPDTLKVDELNVFTILQNAHVICITYNALKPQHYYVSCALRQYQDLVS